MVKKLWLSIFKIMVDQRQDIVNQATELNLPDALTYIALSGNLNDGAEISHIEISRQPLITH